MKSLKFRSFKQVLPSSAVAVALLGLVAITSPARADIYVLCPSAANQNGSGLYTFTSVAGTPICANSAVKIDIPTEGDYARLMWDSTVAAYPAGLTLGNLAGLSADVQFTGLAGDQPYYMLAFTDPTKGLGQNAPTDQILMLEFQNTGNLSGNTMAVDPNTTLFNLYDNTTGVYLNGGNFAGQQVTNSLAGWLAADSFLASESLQQVRTAIGNSGGGSSPESLTVNSLTITSAVPEPTSLLLLLTVVGATGLGIRRKQARNPRG